MQRHLGAMLSTRGWHQLAATPLAPETLLLPSFCRNDEREPWQRLPSASLGLTQLRTLGWLLPPSDAALPCGDEDADGYSGASAAWMSGLRSLALPADVARRSRGQLRGAVALEELCLTGWEASEKDAQK